MIDACVLLKATVVDGGMTDVELQYDAGLTYWITFIFGNGEVWEIPRTLLLEGIVNGKSGTFEVKVKSTLTTTGITLNGRDGTCTLLMNTTKLQMFVERTYKIRGDGANPSLWVVGLLANGWKPAFHEDPYRGAVVIRYE